MTQRAAGPRFWVVILLLLGAARKRTAGRIRRQLKLRGGGFGAAGPVIGFAFVIILAIVLNFGAAVEVAVAVSTAERVQAEARGRVIVEEWFAGRVENYEADAAKAPSKRAQITRAEDRDIAIEAERLAHERNGDRTAIAEHLTATVRHEPKALLSSKSLWWQPGALPDVVALIFVAWWGLMLICQGEGPELDTLRPRNPIWEWLFSHPVSPAAVFFAEMIASVAANPIYLTAPLFPGMLFGLAYGWPSGIAAASLVGLPLAIALACVGKSIEIWAMLRLSPRTRGGVLGLMGWFGFASVFVFLFMFAALESIVTTVSRWLLPFAELPWPPTRLLLGQTASGHFVFWLGLALCWLLTATLVTGAIALSVVSTRRGLTYRSTSRLAQNRSPAAVRFGRDPLYRKELLWFRRDGSAIVQAVLVPLSLAALQAFNLRGLISNAAQAWNMICGSAILFGTYFLLIVGPRSLVSEGQALWIAQTWPRGLESLLKAKAKLWAEIASIVVGAILLYAAFRFPSDIGGILVAGIAWYVFARSLADKTVTLATVTTSSGEREKLPVGRRWAATLGTLTFAFGVLTHQWSLTIAGVVYSMLTAAAMWQNFRYRLPYLSDPWSETLPTPPTLLHAMVAISGMVEGISVLFALALWTFGDRHAASITAAVYGLCAIVAAVSVSYFLASRGVAQQDIWLWSKEDRKLRPLLGLDTRGKMRVVIFVAVGAALGAALGLGAQLYLAILHWWPDLARLLDEGRQRTDALPDARLAVLFMAVLFAPLAEEFLFRGLLYRALDGEWGGWRAVVGAGAFFAVYHPVLSWVPVAALGMMNAMLFKYSGRLAPAIAAHMAYNALVLAF